MFRSEIFDFFPEPGTSKAAGPDDPPGFADWAMDVFPALLEGDVPFYSHEIDAYWNDIGNLDELRQGNLDALRGAVEVEPGAPEVADGRARRELAGRRRGRRRRCWSAPAWRSATACASRARRSIGDGCRIGDGAMRPRRDPARRRRAAAGSMLVGGIAGSRRKRL